MSGDRNDPSSFYRQQNTSTFQHSNVEAQQRFASGVLLLTPIGGIARGARAARWAAHGARRFKYSRGKGFRWRNKKGKFRKPPPSVASDAAAAKAAYSRSRKAVNRRIPLRRARRDVDKWQGRFELATNPRDYLTRKIAGRVVPGGMITTGGVRYLISSLPSRGSGGPTRITPTHRRRPKRPGAQDTSDNRSGHTFAPGAKKSSRSGGKRASCPPGHYYSFKHRQCRPSKYRR